MLVLRVGKSQFARSSTDAAAMRQHGVRTEQAENGREALEFLRLYEYDLVLMDLNLPDMPGHEVVRMMRAADFKVPVLMLADTATAQAKARARPKIAVACGATPDAILLSAFANMPWALP